MKNTLRMGLLILTIFVISCTSDDSFGYKSNPEKLSKKVKKVKIVEKAVELKTIAELKSNASGKSIRSFIYRSNEITYRIFLMGDTYDFGSIYVINETKEKLEIKVLKEQLKQLKGY